MCLTSGEAHHFTKKPCNSLIEITYTIHPISKDIGFLAEILKRPAKALGILLELFKSEIEIRSIDFKDFNSFLNMFIQSIAYQDKNNLKAFLSKQIKEDLLTKDDKAVLGNFFWLCKDYLIAHQRFYSGLLYDGLTGYVNKSKLKPEETGFIMANKMEI